MINQSQLPHIYIYTLYTVYSYTYSTYIASYSHNSARGHREEQPQVVALPIPPYLAAWHQQRAPPAAQQSDDTHGQRRSRRRSPTARDLRGSWWLQNVDVQKMCFENIKMCWEYIYVIESMCMWLPQDIQTSKCWHVGMLTQFPPDLSHRSAGMHGSRMSRAAKGGLQRATVANQTVDLFRGFSTVGAAQQVHQIPASTLMFEPHIILKIWCVQLGSRPV